MKEKTTAKVLSQREIAPRIYDLWLESGLAAQAKPGQFIGVYPKNAATLLPRPISICEVNGERTALRIVYRIAGKGTAEFSTLKENDSIDILGTLGNGFSLEAGRGKRCFLMGGGIGIPPMLQLARELEADKSMIMGYRDGNLFLAEDFGKYGRVYVATEDGSRGTKGNVLDAIEENGLKADVIYACGPMPMLRAVKEYARRQGIRAYISLEEHMACGVGACLGCATPMTDGTMKHVCKDGPVFDASEVDWNG